MWILRYTGRRHLLKCSALLCVSMIWYWQRFERKFQPKTEVNTVIVREYSTRNIPTTDVTVKQMCPDKNSIKRHDVEVSVDSYKFNMSDVIKNNSDVDVGGVWRPKPCLSQHRVAIIIPYRDRERHLTILLSYLLPILKKQQLDFRIYVVEQYGNGTFNKGRIMNAAFKEATKDYDFKCVVFHDVDMVPENDAVPYSCPTQPLHLSSTFNERFYKFLTTVRGGVVAMSTDHFEKVNGYSNEYWGWGAEDDDIVIRFDVMIPGGVVAMLTKHFAKVNGYSNEYWRWGAKDDEIVRRFRQ